MISFVTIGVLVLMDPSSIWLSLNIGEIFSVAVIIFPVPGAVEVITPEKGDDLLMICIETFATV